MMAFTTLTIDTSNAPVRGIAAGFRAMARRIRGVAGVLIRRKDMNVLARADDRMLADIGITRGDLNDALSSRPWEDPTTLLRARALERRLGRQGISLGFDCAPPLVPDDGLGGSSTNRSARWPT